MTLDWKVLLVLACGAVGCSDPEPSSSEQAAGVSRPDPEALGSRVRRAVQEELARRDAELPKYLSNEDLATARECREVLALFDEVEESDAAPAGAVAGCTFGLETRDHQVWLHTGTEPQLYTVRAKDGTTLADAIDDARLKLDYPELHALVHDTVDLIDY